MHSSSLLSIAHSASYLIILLPDHHHQLHMAIVMEQHNEHCSQPKGEWRHCCRSQSIYTCVRSEGVLPSKKTVVYHLPRVLDSTLDYIVTRGRLEYKKLSASIKTATG
eukprot:scpid87559/ scgid35265/ 